MKLPIRIGALISGTGTNLQAVIDACETGRVDGKIVFVGSDRPNAPGLERAHRRGIDTFTVDYGSIIRQFRRSDAALPLDFDAADTAAKQTLFSADVDPERLQFFLRTRAIAEAALLKKMAATPFDLLILAGFMRTLTPYFIDRVNTDADHPRIMNIHPALLPAFPGTDGYGDTFYYGCKVGGSTVHFVDYGEDSGAIIGQRTFEILPQDSLETVRAKGLALEWELYPTCIQLFARGRLKLVRRPSPGPPTGAARRTVVEIRPQ